MTTEPQHDQESIQKPFGRHGAGMPADRASAQASPADSPELQAEGQSIASAETAIATESDDRLSETAKSIGGNAMLISLCVVASRITGFLRTWAMAFALGSTFLASSYQVANNLPNMLYELAVGGMLVTAFLPVYVSTKKRLGKEGGDAYASNLLTLTVMLLGIVAILCTIFSAQLIFTQSFMSDQATMDTSVFFFRFFAIQIVFYGVSAIVSGLLNANRDFLWSSIAPAFNNVIVIITFLAYAFVAPSDPTLALWIIAIGNPLGVFTQMAMQIPALRRNGIRLRPRIDFKDPGLRETLQIGVPAVLVMAMSFVIVSVQNAVALDATKLGPAVILYARLWFTLPYAFLAVPITTAMFTELAELEADDNKEEFRQSVMDGTRQIVFLTTPFMLYLMIFSMPLVSLYHAGAFTSDNIAMVAFYLCALAVSLPIYGVNTYLQKIYSALRMMGTFAKVNLVCASLQIAFTIFFGSYVFSHADIALEFVALGECVFYIASDCICFAILTRRFGHMGLGKVLAAFVQSLLLGAMGAAVGGAVMFGISTLTGGFGGSIPEAFLYLILGGIPAVLVTFGIAVKMQLPGAQFVTNAASGFMGKIKRKMGRA